MSFVPGKLGRTFLAAGLLHLAVTGIGAQSGPQRLTPAEVKWPSSGSSLIGSSGATGIQTVTLKGEPGKAGLYTILMRVPPNTRIEAHAHPDDRVASVVSGTWYFGYGPGFDEKGLKELPPGSFYTEPPGANHFALTKGEAVVLQVTGYGPTGTTYVDSKNDPTTKK